MDCCTPCVLHSTLSRLRDLQFISPAVVAQCMGETNAEEEPVVVPKSELREVVTSSAPPPQSQMDVDLDKCDECCPVKVTSVISSDALDLFQDPLFITARSASPGPAEIIGMEKSAVNLMVVEVAKNEGTQIAGEKMPRDFSASTQCVEVIPQYSPEKEGEGSSAFKMGAAVSALVALGSGVMGMLGPLTQYSTQTSLSTKDGDSQEEMEDILQR
jgi:hypothetical protein